MRRSAVALAVVLAGLAWYATTRTRPTPTDAAGPGAAAPPAAAAAVSAPRSAADSARVADSLRSARPPLLPDLRLTPGAALAVAAADVCTPGYARAVRNVPQSVKRQAYAEYGVTAREPGEYEVDHLISLELGGSNALANLWPQSYRTVPWNAGVKDRLENELHRLVCAGQLELGAAQREIAGDWTAAYRRRFGPPPADGGPNAAAGRGRGGA